MLKTDQLNLRVEPETKTRLRVLAKTWGKERGRMVTMSAVVRELVRLAYQESASSQMTARVGY